MKQKLVIQGIALCFVFQVSAGCTVSRASEAEKMYVIGSALTKLCASVEATVRYGDPPVGISDEELLTIATKHDPGLLVPFADFKVRINQEEKHAAILVCNKEGGKGLLEDACCSAQLDKYLWNAEPSNQCEFTIDIKAICVEPAPQ